MDDRAGAFKNIFGRGAGFGIPLNPLTQGGQAHGGGFRVAGQNGDLPSFLLQKEKQLRTDESGRACDHDFHIPQLKKGKLVIKTNHHSHATFAHVKHGNFTTPFVIERFVA